jgi:SAM-dependent methyltransferase
LSTTTLHAPEEFRFTLLEPAEAATWSASEHAQQKHYDLIAPEYEEHYSDAASLEYRRRFIYEPMFDGLDLSGMTVLDAMCGSGQTTDYLVSRGAQVTGLDLSYKVIEQFKSQWPTCHAVERSILESGFRDNSFDCISIVGGLHHMHPHLNQAVREIHRILKPGGHFCFMEPHAGSLPNLIRRVWYKHDRFFADNEAAIDLTSMKAEFDSQFHFKCVSYRGNLAFLLVLNSLIFRIPVHLKPHYSPLLMSFEAMLSKLQGKLNSCFAVGQWQKRPAA